MSRWYLDFERISSHHLKARKGKCIFLEEPGFGYGEDVEEMLGEKGENKGKCAAFTEKGEREGTEMTVLWSMMADGKLGVHKLRQWAEVGSFHFGCWQDEGKVKDHGRFHLFLRRLNSGSNK